MTRSVAAHRCHLAPRELARARRERACDRRCAFATTFAISPARSSGIVATTIPPASRIPSHAAIASGVFGECSSTRSPGSIASAAATAVRALAQLRRSSTPPPRSPTPSWAQQLDRGVHARPGPSSSSRSGQAERGGRWSRAKVSRQRRSSRAMISCWTSDAPS